MIITAYKGFMESIKEILKIIERFLLLSIFMARVSMYFGYNMVVFKVYMYTFLFLLGRFL